VPACSPARLHLSAPFRRHARSGAAPAPAPGLRRGEPGALKGALLTEDRAAAAARSRSCSRERERRRAHEFRHTLP
jgi:hypothetical protein